MRSRVYRSAIGLAVMVGCLAFTAFAAEAPVLQVSSSRPGAAVEIDRVVDDGKVIVSVVDEAKKPLFGLGIADFAVSLGTRAANVVAAQPLAESLDVPRHIVLVLDNSDSMRQRHAVDALLEGVGEVLKTIRPIDDVRIVAFTSLKQTVSMGGRTLHVQTYQSSKPDQLLAFAQKVYREGITDTTVLYEGMLAGLELIRTMPDTEPRFLVVFSDGEDVNSAFKRQDVLKTAKGVRRFSAYAIDYMPGPQTDAFLSEFASANRGQIFKAASEASLVPIFQSVASKMQYFYVVSYVFPLTGTLAVTPGSLTIEEIKTIDASPMLAQVFFAEDSGEIPAAYLRFASPDQTAGFDEQKFRDTLEKYYQVLNIVGKRLADNPQATLTVVGCNANVAKEKNNKALSTQRAEAVRNYLQTIWSIDPARLALEARGLPAMPSAGKLKEGQAENRRVELRASDPAVLAPIRSVYLATRIDAAALTARPDGIIPGEIASWNLTAANTAGNLAELSGTGAPAAETQVPLPTKDLPALAAGGDIAVKMELTGKKGQSLALSPAPVKVTFIQTSQLLAQKQEQKVQEKYALILFDFDKDTIDARNQAIVDRVAARIRELPQATVEIVGHTDSIGKEAYNIKLSERRALAVYKLLEAACGAEAATRIHYTGVGPNTPLYDNTTPEARSFNRTVTITLEYLSKE